MAIKIDGHTITALQLKASDGSEVTKQLTEEGTIPTPTEALSITANGTYDVTTKASAVVNVPAPEINLQNKTATANGEVTADEGYDGLSKVVVNVSGDVPTLITKSITANGTYNASADSADGYSSVTVNVPVPEANLQDKTVTTNGTYSADEGYDGLGEVTVNVSGGADFQTFTTTSVIGDGGKLVVNGIDLTTAKFFSVFFTAQNPVQQSAAGFAMYCGNAIHFSDDALPQFVNDSIAITTTGSNGTPIVPNSQNIQDSNKFTHNPLAFRYFSGAVWGTNFGAVMDIQNNAVTIDTTIGLDVGQIYDVVVKYI